MKIESINKEVQEKVMQLLNDAPAEKKAEAIMQSIEMIQEAAHEDLVNQVVAEAERASHDADFKKQLGLRNLSQEEKKFYEGFKDIKQSITANQIDIIPTEIIDRTLDDVKKAWQVSFYSRTPRNEKLIMLRDMMRKKGLHPTILHEFITDDKIWHSYFSLETMNE